MSERPTVVMAEGRRLMRLSRELPADRFEALLVEYRRLLREVWSARDVEGEGDTAWATFPTPAGAARAAAAAVQAVVGYEWPHGGPVSISVGVGRTAGACEQLCDTADGGEIFVDEETAELLRAEELAGLDLRDRGEPRARRSGRAVRAYELVPVRD